MEQQSLIIQSPAELLQAGSTEGARAKVVEVVPAVIAESLSIAVERGMAMIVDSPESMAEAVKNLKFTKSVIASMEDRLTELRKPILAEAAKLSADMRAALSPAVRLVEIREAQIKEYDAAVEAERQRQISAAAEARRKAEEAQRAAEAEQRRQAEAARIEAERQEQAAQLLRFQQEEAERRAVEDLENARKAGDTAAADKAMADLAETQRLDAEAQAAQAAANEAARLAQFKAEAPKVEVLAPKVEVLAPVNRVGVARLLKKHAQLDHVDVSKLPVTYLLANEKLIKKHLDEGVKSIPGVTHRMV